jgi:hypothetical protein
MAVDAYTTKPEKVDSSWLRRLSLNFEKRISKNAELRAKFETEPQKYVEDVHILRWVHSDELL